MAVEIEGLGGIVPVADFEEPLHDRSGGIFQGCGRKHTQKPDQRQAFGNGEGGKENENGA